MIILWSFYYYILVIKYINSPGPEDLSINGSSLGYGNQSSFPSFIKPGPYGKNKNYLLFLPHPMKVQCYSHRKGHL